MNRQQKSLVIEALKSDFSHSQASFLVGLKGLTVVQLQTLRRELRKDGGTLRVAKARFMKLAIKEMPAMQDMSPYLREQVGLVFVQDRFMEVAKTLATFSKAHAALTLVVGSLGQEVVAKEKIVRMASLPSREVLLAQICGTINAPGAKLVRLLNKLVTQLSSGQESLSTPQEEVAVPQEASEAN